MTTAQIIIFIIETDKPSRLFKNKTNNNLGIADFRVHPDWKPQNIYITNSETPKDDGYVLWEDKAYKYKDFMKMKTPVYTDYFSIIFTDNKDLIADGVQEVPEDFLQWFINNSSCEFVDIEKDVFYSKKSFIEGKNCITYKYKIIIPQKEPKQENQEYTSQDFLNEICWNKFKQETLEEDDLLKPKQDRTCTNNCSVVCGECEIFESKQEESFNYDEMRRIAYNAFCLGQLDNPTEGKFNKWIKQFKK